MPALCEPTSPGRLLTQGEHSMSTSDLSEVPTGGLVSTSCAGCCRACRPGSTQQLVQGVHQGWVGTSLARTSLPAQLAQQFKLLQAWALQGAIGRTPVSQIELVT